MHHPYELELLAAALLLQSASADASLQGHPRRETLQLQERASCVDSLHHLELQIDHHHRLCILHRSKSLSTRYLITADLGLASPNSWAKHLYLRYADEETHQ